MEKMAGQYFLTKVIGEGGFGTTYAAKDTLTGKKFAIKEFFPGRLCERITDEVNGYHIRVYEKKKKSFQKELVRFQREAEFLKKCADFKTIPDFVDYFEDNQTAYIVMEYIEGLTLETYIQENGTLEYTELLSLFAPLLTDLEKIHVFGLVHYDISPDNIIIDLDNFIHLIDFGIAGSYLADDRHHTIILKNGFAAPEQYSPSGKTGPWTDVYGVSSTMYYALTGCTPGVSKERGENELLELAGVLQNIKTWQKAALLKGMSLNPASRFQDIRTFHLALVRKDVIGRLETVHMVPQGFWKKRNVAVLLILVVSLIAGSVGVFAWRRSDSERSVFAGAKGSGQGIETVFTENPEKAAANILTMPKLTGLTLAKAKKKLHMLDDEIRIKTVWKKKSTVAKNTVIQQGIPKGFLFEKGSMEEILLVVSAANHRNQYPVETTAAAGGSTNGSRAGKQEQGNNSSNQTTGKSSDNHAKNTKSDKNTGTSDSDGFTVHGKDEYVDLDIWDE